MSERENGLFKVAAAAVVVNEQNEILLTRRSLNRDHHPGRWEILAGRLEKDESFEDALDREAHEELGIGLAILTILSTFHFYRGVERDEHVGISFLAKQIDGVVKVDGIEEIDFAWVSIPKALEMVTDSNIRNSLLQAERYLKSDV